MFEAELLMKKCSFWRCCVRERREVRQGSEHRVGTPAVSERTTQPATLRESGQSVSVSRAVWCGREGFR